MTICASGDNHPFGGNVEQEMNGVWGLKSSYESIIDSFIKIQVLIICSNAVNFLILQVYNIIYNISAEAQGLYFFVAFWLYKGHFLLGGLQDSKIATAAKWKYGIPLQIQVVEWLAWEELVLVIFYFIHLAINQVISKILKFYLLQAKLTSIVLFEVDKQKHLNESEYL